MGGGAGGLVWVGGYFCGLGEWVFGCEWVCGLVGGYVGGWVGGQVGGWVGE